MTNLHNSGVPSRSMLTVRRAKLHGRRYRVAIGRSARGRSAIGRSWWSDDAVLTRYFRADGAACALAMLHPSRPPTAADLREQIDKFRRTPNALATLRELCDAALTSLDLPDGFGFFVDENQSSRLPPLPVAATIALLAARSGPLYLPGRFEPSLITAGVSTLFFPSFEESRGVR
jgi:hypothetical protein